MFYLLSKYFAIVQVTVLDFFLEYSQINRKRDNIFIHHINYIAIAIVNWRFDKLNVYRIVGFPVVFFYSSKKRREKMRQQRKISTQK